MKKKKKKKKFNDKSTCKYRIKLFKFRVMWYTILISFRSTTECTKKKKKKHKKRE
ncbi:hypothetical protein PGB90_007173 [Kerria lacca]